MSFPHADHFSTCLARPYHTGCTTRVWGRWRRVSDLVPSVGMSFLHQPLRPCLFFLIVLTVERLILSCSGL